MYSKLVLLSSTCLKLEFEFEFDLSDLMESGGVFVCKIKHLICKTFRSLCTNSSLVLLWLNSSVLFTWEINLRLCDDIDLPTDAWTNTETVCAQIRRWHTHRQIWKHVFASLEHKHTQYACAQSTYLHTLIENWQTHSPTCHIVTMHSHYLAWNASMCISVCRLSDCKNNNELHSCIYRKKL